MSHDHAMSLEEQGFALALILLVLSGGLWLFGESRRGAPMRGYTRWGGAYGLCMALMVIELLLYAPVIAGLQLVVATVWTWRWLPRSEDALGTLPRPRIVETMTPNPWRRWRRVGFGLGFTGLMACFWLATVARQYKTFGVHLHELREFGQWSALVSIVQRDLSGAWLLLCGLPCWLALSRRPFLGQKRALYELSPVASNLETAVRDSQLPADQDASDSPQPSEESHS